MKTHFGHAGVGVHFDERALWSAKWAIEIQDKLKGK